MAVGGAASPYSSQGSQHHATSVAQKKTSAKRKTATASSASSAGSNATGNATTQTASKKRGRAVEASEVGSPEAAWAQPAKSQEESGAAPPAKRQVSKAPRKASTPQDRASHASSSGNPAGAGSTTKNNPHSPVLADLPAGPAPGSNTVSSPHQTPASKVPRSITFVHPSTASDRAHSQPHGTPSLPRSAENRAESTHVSTPTNGVTGNGGVITPSDQANVRSPGFQAPPTLPNYLRVASSPHHSEESAYPSASQGTGSEEHLPTGHMPVGNLGNAMMIHRANPNSSSAMGMNVSSSQGVPMSVGGPTGPQGQAKYPPHGFTPTYGSTPNTPSAANSSSYGSSGATNMNGGGNGKQQTSAPVGSPAQQQQQVAEDVESRHSAHRRPSIPQVRSPNGMWSSQGEQQYAPVQSPQQMAHMAVQDSRNPAAAGQLNAETSSSGGATWNGQPALANAGYHHQRMQGGPQGATATMPAQGTDKQHQIPNQNRAPALPANRLPPSSTSYADPNSSSTASLISHGPIQGLPHYSGHQASGSGSLPPNYQFLASLESLTGVNVDIINYLPSIPPNTQECYTHLVRFRKNLAEMLNVLNCVLGPVEGQLPLPVPGQQAPTGPKNNMAHPLHQSGPQMKPEQQKQASSVQPLFAPPAGQRSLAASTPAIPSSQQSQHASMQQNLPRGKMAQQQMAGSAATAPLPQSSAQSPANQAGAHVATQHQGTMTQPQRYGYRPQEFSPVPTVPPNVTAGPSYYEALLQHHNPHPLSHQSQAMEMDPPAATSQWTHPMQDIRPMESHMMNHQQMHQATQQQQQHQQQHQQHQQQRQDPRMAANRPGFYPGGGYPMESGNHFAPSNMPHWSPSGHHPAEVASAHQRGQ